MATTVLISHPLVKDRRSTDLILTTQKRVRLRTFREKITAMCRCYGRYNNLSNGRWIGRWASAKTISKSLKDSLADAASMKPFEKPGIHP